MHAQRIEVASSQRATLGLAVRVLEQQEAMHNPASMAIANALDGVILGEHKRLLISVPPGYGKTLNCVWSFIARGFLINPKSRYITSSYSEDLALDNSAKIKQLIESKHWQAMMPMTLRKDTQAKGLWRNEHGGGLRAAASGSGITGFRAGQMTQRRKNGSHPFSGAMIIDDPTKPSDVSSKKKTSEKNEIFSNTMVSRLAHEDVPIIVIMQRLCSYSGDFTEENLTECGDLSEYLLRGGSGEVWSHLELPVEIDRSQAYPAEWTHGERIEHNLPDGPLWEYKHNEMDIARLKRANIYVYAAQYAQRPKKRTGDPLIEGKWFNRYREVPKLKNIQVFADTANKKKESSDYSVLLAAGITHDNQLYLLDVLRKKWRIPQLYPAVKDFWNKWKGQGATKINIEDAASGTFLIQSLEDVIKFSVEGITRDTDKFTRVNGVTERISSGHVHVPADAPWVSDFIQECEDFTDDDSHDHDDQVDVLCDAIEKLVHTRPVETKEQFIPGFY